RHGITKHYNMFSPTRTVIDAFVECLITTFEKAYPGAQRAQSGRLEQSARMALESLTNSDCSYHDLNHTIMVTDVGQSILWGRLTSQGDVTAHDWLHAILPMLYQHRRLITCLLQHAH